MPLLQCHRQRTLINLLQQQLFRTFSTTSAAAAAAVAHQQPASAAPALNPAFSQPLLYRDFIQQSLYHPDLGYFNGPAPPIRRLAQPLNFNRLVGQVEYRLELARAYKQLQVDWLTPVEVFAPWYGRAVAHYILELRRHDSSIDSSTPLSIVEIGGGTGTLAASILDYVCEMDQAVYSSMSYTTIEISSSLAALQEQYILGERNHGSTWRLVPGDASQLSTWQQVWAQLPRQHRPPAGQQQQQQQQQHTFVLMMEVLDNLPHDRVVRQDANSPWQQAAVQTVQPAAEPPQQQAVANGSSSGRHRNGWRVGDQQQQQQPQYDELLLPATDPLIQRCCQALQLTGDDDSSSSSSGNEGLASWLQRALGLEDEQSSQNNVWLPTRCLQLLETLHAALPSHTLIAADFDALPDIRVAGRGGPLVSGRGEGGAVQDYGSVLVPWGSADIFFPTDFDGLGRLYEAAAVQQQQQQQQGVGSVGRQVSASHSSTGDFMSAFAEAKRTTTLSGYNPLVQDWQNTRIFVGQATAG